MGKIMSNVIGMLYVMKFLNYCLQLIKNKLVALKNPYNK